MAPKPDADRIVTFLTELPGELGLDPRRRPWPKFIYRFDDVRNVAKILQSGRLLSREQCIKGGVEFHDAANREIIGNTEYAHHYVRLYFRPLTPTQYRMEGILAQSQIRSTGEHCPVPVFLLFNSKQLLTQSGVRFTNGSTARRGQYEVGESVEFLESLPFEAIYHEGRIYGDEDEKREIVFRRHAEVLVERELDLSTLDRVVCRTGPERDTLLTLLGSDAAEWGPRTMIARPGDALFYRIGTYIEEVRLVGDQLHFRFPPRQALYRATVEVTDPRSGRVIMRREVVSSQLSGWRKLVLPEKPAKVAVRFEVEEALAYQGIVSQQALFGA